MVYDRWNTEGVHDPTIIQDKETKSFYMFSTDTYGSHGVQVRKSDDLLNWTRLNEALDPLPKDAYAYSGAGGLWAPEVIEYKDKYYMYYSASTFGSTRSAIGLAISTSLEGVWEDQGIVVKTNKEIADHNAIDANIICDKEGTYWMCYGSFFGGIHIVEMNMETGFTKVKDDYGTCIARRDQSVEGAIEGPFIIYNESTDYYYLFTSYDFLGNTYNIRVARSKSITGPYTDFNNLSMIGNEVKPDSNGLKIMGSYRVEDEESYLGPGHNSILKYKDDYILVSHVRCLEKEHKHHAMIRRIVWVDGWPLVSLNPYVLESKINSSAKPLDSYECVEFNGEMNSTVNSAERLFETLFAQSKHMIVVDEYSIIHQQKLSNIYSINKDGTVTIGYRRREE